MKTLRLSKKYSQLELSKIVGVSRQTIVSVENGDYNPTLDLCIKICKALDVTLNDLFWREEN
ncbi:MAG: helix-turn-helix transcriptional regulator [Erysipelothrix sp.]